MWQLTKATGLAEPHWLVFFVFFNDNIYDRNASMVERSTQIDTLSAFLVLPSSCHSRTTIYRQAFPVSALSSMTIIISFFVFQGSASRLGISKAKCFRIHIANVDIRPAGQLAFAVVSLYCPAFCESWQGIPRYPRFWPFFVIIAVAMIFRHSEPRSICQSRCFEFLAAKCLGSLFLFQVISHQLIYR